MKKDILIDLDSILNNKSTLTESFTAGSVPNEVIARLDLVEKYQLPQSRVDSMTTLEVLQEYDTRINNTKYIDIDIVKIVREWSWRCDKGYPDYNNVIDRLQLQEVLDEMNIPLPFDRINEAPKPIKSTDTANNYPKTLLEELEKSNKLDKFIKFVNTLPGGIIPQVVLKEITNACSSSSNVKELVKVFKSKQSLNSITDINPESGINLLLFNIQPKGIGPGELLISWYVDDVIIQGGTVPYDIEYKGQKWEVKSLITTKSNAPGPIDPAKYGKINNFKFTKDFQSFFETVIDPYYENKLRDSVLTLTDSESVRSKLNELLSVLETMPRTTADGSTLLSASIGEMTTSLFNKFYNGIVQINKLLPKSVKNAAKASRISVKSDTTDAQYWIDPSDIEDITKNAGKDTTVSIKIGNQITDENKDAKIWLANLMNNVFIKNPEYFVNSLRSIRDGFNVNKDGIIYLTKGKFNIGDDMNDFFTSSITRSTYRFDLKSQQKFANYKYAQNQ